MSEAEEGPAMGDCEVCGSTIHYGDPDGTLRPDADAFCDECGARHVCNVESDDAWLILAETAPARIDRLAAELAAARAEVERLKSEKLPANTSKALELLRDFYIAFHKPEWEEGECAEEMTATVRLFLDQAAADGWREADIERAKAATGRDVG